MAAGIWLLALPCPLLAQRGGGGGHIGGPSAGGGAMGSSGPATGVNVKDDLRTFHEIMAVQASREQIAAFAQLAKSTEAAAAELKQFQDVSGRDNSAASLAGHDKTLEDAVEAARLLNKNFLAGFSEAQKTGLKEMLKRLAKADAELAQEAKAVDRAVEVNASSSQIGNAAQSLDRALENFQRTQGALGEEMSIPAATVKASTFNLTPTRNTFTVGNLPIRVTATRTVSRIADSVAVGAKAGSAAAGNVFSVEVNSDLSDLQLSIADLLRNRLNRTSGCGERIAVRTAELTSRGASAVAEVQMHFERWACTTMMGRESMNEIVESEGSAQFTLTPEVSEDGTLHLRGEIADVRAEGPMAESLRHGALGEELRDKVAESVLSLLRQCADFKATLPASAGKNVALKRAEFRGTGSGRLAAIFQGEMKVSDDQVQAVIGDLGKASAADAIPGPLLPRPAAQEATPR